MINIETNEKSNDVVNPLGDISISGNQPFGSDEIESPAEITNKKFSSNNRKRTRNRVISYLTILVLVIGIAVSLALLSKSQDNRQQASGGDPYATPSISPDTEHRPETKEICRSVGVWIGAKCYVYWEVLPEGTHMVVPGEYNSYGYAALVPIDEAKEILDVANGSIPSPTSIITKEITVAPPSVTDDGHVVTCNQEFKLIGGICMPDQKSPNWNSDWINKHGCGAMQALYYAMQLDPNLDPDTFVEKYYSSYMDGENQGNTYDSENIRVLEDLGYTVEPYTKSIIANGYKEINNNGTFFVKGVFSGGVNHYFSISNIYTDENGRTIFNTVDSYYNIDKCVASSGNVMNCYDSDNKQVTSIDLSDPETSTYLVI